MLFEKIKYNKFFLSFDNAENMLFQQDILTEWKYFTTLVPAPASAFSNDGNQTRKIYFFIDEVVPGQL